MKNYRLTKKKDYSLKMRCKICSRDIHAKLEALTNVNKHFWKHVKSAKWYFTYQKRKDGSSKNTLSEAEINLVKFFISSNLAYTQLQNRYLRVNL